MSCYLCGSSNCIEVLNKSDVYVWTNASDDIRNKKAKYKCVLLQCKDCGHVYQPLSGNLRKILKQIYETKEEAHASTMMGKGTWGMKRAESFLETLDLEGCHSAVEIGCADGYILQCLKNKGFDRLIGIEPSLKNTEEFEGIRSSSHHNSKSAGEGEYGKVIA